MSYSTISKARMASALLATTMLSTGLAAPAAAQTSPPVYRNLDANGVDLTQGDYVMGLKEGSIGSGDAELELIRDNGYFSGANGHRWDSVFLSEFSAKRSVSFGQSAEWFTGTSSQQGNGSTLTLVGSDYVHRAADGTITAFTKKDPNCTPTSTSACMWVPSTITSPNGKTVNLAYEQWLTCTEIIDEGTSCTVDAVRLQQVSNAAGYSIAFTYANNSSLVPDWFKRTRADFYNSAVGSTSQGNVTYAYPSSSVTDVTDMAGQSWRITNSSFFVNAIRRPGVADDLAALAVLAADYSANAHAWSTRYQDDDKRHEYIDALADRLRHLDTLPIKYVHAMEDFGTDWKLKPGIEPQTIGHQPWQPPAKQSS